MKEGNELSWAQVVMAANAPVMTKAALVEGRTDVGVLPTGQVVGVLETLPSVADIVATIMAEADDVLRRLGAREPQQGAGETGREETGRD